MMLLNTLFVQQSKASHAMGADLTYQCLGGNTYRITLSFYRDCIGIPAPTNPFVNINSASCGQSLGITCYPRTGTGKEITPACSSAVTTCQGGSFTGIQEWVYDGIVTLPANCTDWVFGYNLCCRNAAITTITSPGTSTFYIYATLNNTITPNNSSPVFSNKPVPFLCVGQQYCFNHGAYDADGDSLAYSLITPKQTSGTTVNYIAPYNASNPLNSVPATSFNTFTGDICLTPQALQVTVMAVLVKEYRNGVLIGSVERDMQLTVMNCSNNLPTLTGINGTNNFSMAACAGQPFCFDIFSNDPDAGQNLTVTWDGGIPGGTFTTTPTQHPTSTFCWTPGASDISGTPHVFTVRVADDACPYVGSQIYSYSITVIGLRVNAGPDQNIACSDIATISATASGGTGTYAYLWSTGSTMQSITVPGGTYTVTASDGVCSATDTVVIAMPFKPTSAFNLSSSNCMNYSIHFYDQSTTPGGILDSWQWDFGDGSTGTIQNPVHYYAAPGSYPVTLIVGNTLGCYDTLVQNVNINPPPTVAFAAPNSCAGQTVAFTDQSVYGEGLNYWSWNFGDTTTSSAENPTHTYNSGGTYTVTLVAGDSLGCVDTAYRVIHIYPLPSVYAGVDQTVCLGNSATLTASGGSSYTWSPTGDTASTIVVTPGSTTNYYLSLTDTNGCVGIDVVSVVVNPLPVATAGPDQNICIGSSATLTAIGGTNYTWSPGGSNSSSVVVTPGSSTNYLVTVTDANGCTSNDSIRVNVNPLPTANVTPTVHICSGSSTTLTASGGISYNWIPTGSTTPSINVNPTTTTTYTVVVTNGNSCSDSADVVVNVHTAPVVTLQSLFICSGGNATLDAGNPGSTYAWTPSGATTQTINVNTGGTYSVTVTDAYGCNSSSSCTVASGASLNVNNGTISFCQGDSTTLNAGHPGMTYLWSPTSQTTQTITVYTGGTYSVMVTDTSGCTGSITTTIVVNPIPVPNFTATNICLGNATSFTDASSVATGSISTWQWDFGDGNVSTQQNPTHTYPSAGTYNVTLTIKTASGCINSITNIVTVNPLPVANYNFINACQGSSVIFTDASSVSTGNITGYSWAFGDGVTSSLKNPIHSYLTSGNFNVSLQVTTAGGCSNTIIQTITVYPLPVANFTSTTVCSGNQTVFTNASGISTGSITTYDWDFGDSYTSSLQQPNHTYASAGTFNASLILTSSNGCTDTLVQSVIVHALPVANAGADQNICNSSNATLTATGGTSYNWSPGGLNTSVIVVTPVSTTTYSVTVTDVNGCQTTDNVNVNVNPLPTANAGPDQSICVGGSALLTATGGLTYLWSPGGLISSSIMVHPVATTNYIVTVTDANGCKATDTTTVLVNPLPAISAGPDQTICIGSTISISATGGSTYTWNPGGSTLSSILVTPLSNSNYTVIGVDVNGCQSTDTMRVIVNPTPVVNIPTTLVCTGFSTMLDAGNPGGTYQWSTGDNTQTISVTDSGTYIVIVSNAFGCTAIGSAYVTLAGSFSATPTRTSICSGQSTMLNAGNPGCTYLWSNGATTQSINVNTAATYSVTVTDPNGCSATIFSAVALNPNPVAAFTAPATCSGTNTSFTDQSTVSSGTVQTYSWDFGDGYSSSLRNPVHAYQAAGTYNVVLSIASASGCPATMSHLVVINPLPVADFNSTNVCQRLATTFNDLSTVSTGSITSWSWNFGDATTSSSQNPSHIYTAAGNYNVTLIVTSANGCTGTSTKNINVKGLPVAAFSVPAVCAQTSAQFNNLSFSSNGSITSYNWNFGNSTTSNAINPGNLYTADGTYNVQLVVTSALGCSDTATQPITIYPLPNADFATSPVCENSPALFTNNSTVTSGAVSSLYWNFGDGSGSNQINPSHVFGSTGSYTVTLIATTNHQCRDTVIQNLTIHPIPVANFTAQDVCVNSPVNFVDGSTVGAGSIAAWSWNFGDNLISSASQPVHIYTNAGTYSAVLTITSNFGCTNTYNSNVNIFPDPVPAFAAANVCYTNATQFFNQSYIAGGSNFTSMWDFNDGTTSTLNSPSHLYSNPGMYNVTLTVTSLNGCVSQVAQNISVYIGPVVAFTANNGCLGVQTIFNDHTQSADGNVSAWNWQFGDGASSNANSPLHMYSDSGHYNITLTTTTNYGCYNSASGNVLVYPSPSPRISSHDACMGAPVALNDMSGDNASGSLGYFWDFGDGFYSTDSMMTHTFLNPGTFEITLVTSNSYGCFSSDIADVNIYPQPEITFSAPAACYPSATQFSNSSSIGTGNISNYVWSFGDGNVASASNPSHTYPAPGIYLATLIGTSDFGCQNTDTVMIKINPKPQVQFGSSLKGCSPLNGSFLDSSWVNNGSITAWLWDFGDGGVSTSQNPNHLFDQSGVYSITLTVATDEGCQTTLTQPNYVTVYPSPDAAFNVNPDVIDILNPVVQFINLSQGYVSYTWNFSDGTNINNIVSPTHVFSDTGTYFARLIVLNSYGCLDTAFRRIDIHPHSTLFAPNCFTPNGDGKNDIFKPEFTEMTNIQVWIFNRWGELLKSWDSLDGYWDGYYKGNACEQDVYVYKIKGLGDDGKNYEWTGHVSIVH